MAALITFKVDMHPTTGMPTRNLMLEAQKFFQTELGLDLKTSDQAIAEPKVTEFIEKCIEKANK